MKRARRRKKDERLRDGKWGGAAADQASLLAQGRADLRATTQPDPRPERPKGQPQKKNSANINLAKKGSYYIF